MSLKMSYTVIRAARWSAAALVAAVVLLGYGPAAAQAQGPSCGNFSSFGTQQGAAIPYPLIYDLYSGGGGYDAVLAWGDGATSSATVNASNTQANPVSVNHSYTGFGTYQLSISTVGTLSDGTPCSDTNVPIGTVLIQPPAPVSCGSFQTFDPAHPPGTERVTAGDGITYMLKSGDATLQTAKVDWGDGTSSSLPGPLAPNLAYEFPQPPPHTYNRPGTYQVILSVTGQAGNGARCNDRVPIGKVVVASPPTKPLTPAVATKKCDGFLRNASGMVGRIFRQASGKPRTTCNVAKGNTRTCTTVVIVKKKCGCQYTITTRVPASGKPRVVRITKKSLPGGGKPRRTADRVVRVYEPGTLLFASFMLAQPDRLNVFWSTDNL